jgi:type IV fimbrial biogenesis protein FimT
MQMNARCFSGFTLVELAVVLAVIAVLATFSTPSFVAWHQRDQIDARARAMIATLVLARSEAIKRGARVTLCRINAARACLATGKPCDSGMTDWSCGWGLFADRDGSHILLRMQPALAAIAISGTGSELSFTPPSGQIIGGFRSFDFGPRNGKLASPGGRARRCIRLAAGGRARLTQGACGAAA